jgi:hypothetical protein
MRPPDTQPAIAVIPEPALYTTDPFRRETGETPYPLREFRDKIILFDDLLDETRLAGVTAA